jgi:ElaB/YqjD/DUF883 family membrane-anchored ribosome-binding protein
MTEQVKTDVELLKRDMELLAGLAEKFDTAIDRLTDVSHSVDKMLVVHEKRLSYQEHQAEIIHSRINDFKREMLEEFRSLRKENSEQHKAVGERLDKLEKWRWFVVGAAMALGFLVAQSSIVSKLFH